MAYYQCKFKKEWGKIYRKLTRDQIDQNVGQGPRHSMDYFAVYFVGLAFKRILWNSNWAKKFNLCGQDDFWGKLKGFHCRKRVDATEKECLKHKKIYIPECRREEEGQTDDQSSSSRISSIRYFNSPANNPGPTEAIIEEDTSASGIGGSKPKVPSQWSRSRLKRHNDREQSTLEP